MFSIAKKLRFKGCSKNVQKCCFLRWKYFGFTDDLLVCLSVCLYKKVNTAEPIGLNDPREVLWL